MATVATDPYMEARGNSFIARQRAKQSTAETPTESSDSVTPTQPVEGNVDPTAQTADPPPAEDVVAAEPPAQGTDDVPVSDDGEPAPVTEEPPATPTAPEGELDDDTIKTLAEAYGEKFFATEQFQKRVDDAVKQQVQRQTDDYRQQQREQGEIAELLERGETAVNGMFDMIKTAQNELGRSVSEEDYTPPQGGVLNVETFEQHLEDYGVAVLAEADGRYLRSLDKAVLDSIRTLPTLSDEHMGQVQTILNNAARIRDDPNQGVAMGFAYSSSALVSFLVERAREQGVAEERTRAQSRQTVARKLTDSATTKAAAAKLAAERGNTPPAEPTDAKGETLGAPSQALYERLKREGKHDEAQRVVDVMARQAAQIARTA